jgi:hypothetical protein
MKLKTPKAQQINQQATKLDNYLLLSKQLATAASYSFIAGNKHE